MRKKSSKIFTWRAGFLMMGMFWMMGCSNITDSKSHLNLSGNFEYQGLAETEIYSIKQYVGAVYAATDSGLFIKQNRGGSWERLGTLNLTVWAFVILPDNEILAALFSESEDSINIVLSIDNGETWKNYRNGFGGSKRYSTYILESHKEFPYKIFSRSGMSVAKSEDGGKSWVLSYLSWDSVAGKMFLTINPDNPQIIWAGGANALSFPSLLRSTDGGNTWERISVIENVEATIYDVVTFYQHPQKIMVSMGTVRRSVDGGVTWENVFNEGSGILDFTRSARNPKIIYGGGMNHQGKLFFAASNDFGNSWERADSEDSPVNIRVNDMISIMEDGKEVLYFATNKGVYSYTFSE